MIAWRIAAAAPASTPQVGWLTISRRGSRRISRPTMNFCRLPPERLPPPGRACPCARRSPRDAVDERRHLRAESMKPPLHHPGVAAWPLISVFVGQRACAARRRGRAAPPARRRRRAAAPLVDAESARPASPSIPIGVRSSASDLAGERGEQLVLPVAGNARDAENLARRQLRTSMPSSVVPCGSSGVERQSSRTIEPRLGPSSCRRPRSTAPTSRADHHPRQRLRAVSARGSHGRDHPAAAQDRARCRRARAPPPACARCRGSRGPRPAAAAACANSCSASCGVSTEVGSSRISRLAGPATGSARSRCAAARRPSSRQHLPVGIERQAVGSRNLGHALVERRRAVASSADRARRSRPR